MAYAIYMNAFKFGPNLSVPGAMDLFGLWLTMPEIAANLDLINQNFPLSVGMLNASGAAYANIAFPPSLLAGVTLNGVDMLIDPLTGVILNHSNVASYTF